MKNKYEEIILAHARDAPIGMQSAMECPACRARKGVSADEHIASKLYFVREGGIVSYLCFSASCGIKGYIADTASVGMFPSAKQFKPRKFLGKLTLPGKEALEYLRSYNIRNQQITANRFRWNPEGNYLYKPIFNAFSGQIGEWLKQIGEGDGPKNLVFKEVDVPLVDFPVEDTPRPFLTDSLVVVEDPISMLRVSQLTPASALLGTHMSTEVAFMYRGLTDRLILMLDPDATAKAFTIMQNREHILPIKVAPAPAGYDPKDLNTTDLLELLRPFRKAGSK